MSNNELMPLVEGEIIDHQPHVPTPTEQRNLAVANLTKEAYALASTLQLTKAEMEGLKADFPREAFKKGASGKEGLVYIEHAYLRDRMDDVLGVGHWALVTRNRWTENYVSGEKKTPAIRVYVEAMLVVRGCFVGEAIGDMSYFPGNPQTNFGDAIEGAKSSALRRCLKDFGVGLQPWKKGFSEEFFRQGGSAAYQPRQQTQQATRTTAEPVQSTEHTQEQPQAPVLTDTLIASWRVYLENQARNGRDAANAAWAVMKREPHIGDALCEKLKGHTAAIKKISDAAEADKAAKAAVAELPVIPASMQAIIDQATKNNTANWDSDDVGEV